MHLASVPSIDVSAFDMLIDLDDDLGRRHISLLVARDIGQVRDLLQSAGGAALLGRVYPAAEDAVRSISGQPDGESPAPDEP